jgi:hypothetical protein
VKGKEEFQVVMDHTFGFIDEYLEEAISNSLHWILITIIGFQNIMQILVSV